DERAELLAAARALDAAEPELGDRYAPVLELFERLRGRIVIAPDDDPMPFYSEGDALDEAAAFVRRYPAFASIELDEARFFDYIDQLRDSVTVRAAPERPFSALGTLPGINHYHYQTDSSADAESSEFPDTRTAADWFTPGQLAQIEVCLWPGDR